MKAIKSPEKATPCGRCPNLGEARRLAALNSLLTLIIRVLLPTKSLKALSPHIQTTSASVRVQRTDDTALWIPVSRQTMSAFLVLPTLWPLILRPDCAHRHLDGRTAFGRCPATPERHS